MLGLAIEARRRGDEQRIAEVLTRLQAEDPCVKLDYRAATQETVLRGMGELHLRYLLDRLAGNYKLVVDTRPPRVPYQETITRRAEGHCRHKKQTGGAGQFGEVFLRVEPLERGAGFEFVDEITGGAIPSQFIPAVEKGIRQVLASGAIAGYPMQDVRVIVYDGKYHPVDSKEIAFIIAGRRAFQDAVLKAKPTVLEPIVNIEVIAPEASMGTIAGDISGKRGRISGTRTLPNGMIAITGQAPLSELTQYQSQLKAFTGGQGSYTIEFSHYEQVPGNIQQAIVAQYKPKEEAE